MLNQKSILITGGTGSLSKHLVKNILESHEPKKLIVYSRDELKQFEMQQVFSGSKFPCMRYFLGDVRDMPRLKTAMHGVDIVIHAAALKQVPAAEYNPFEAVKTNVFGTSNVSDISVKYNVEKFVLVSTDKAVKPVNVMGATKRLAEMVTQNHNRIQNNTEFNISQEEIIKSINKFELQNEKLNFNTQGFYFLETFSVTGLFPLNE